MDKKLEQAIDREYEILDPYFESLSSVIEIPTLPEELKAKRLELLKKALNKTQKEKKTA